MTSLEAFELDGVVESAPTFQAASFNGNVQITGSFTSGQASALANELKYGSLPVRFVPQSVQTVSATIGKDSLKAGLLAGVGGIILVLLYMIGYYRALGLIVLLFPDGRLPGPRWRWFVGAYLAIGAVWLGGAYLLSVGTK